VRVILLHFVTSARGFTKLRCLALILLLISANAGEAALASVYITQFASGTDAGTSCANAHAVTFFNTAGNWGTAATQIGPGTVVHLCGTFTGTADTNMLTTRGNGALGNVITIQFEPDAVLTAPYWPNSASAAIVVNHSYIVLDGGVNGLITATANGTLLANQTLSDGVHIGDSGAPNNVEIKNLRITNMCVRVRDSSETSCSGRGIKLVHGGGNILINHNVITDVGLAIGMAWTVNSSGDVISNNTIANVNGGIWFSPCANGITVTGLIIRDNDIGSMANWDDPANVFHHDSIHGFNCGGTTGTHSGTLIHGNYIHGDFGNHATSAVFIQPTWANVTSFNNLIVLAAGRVTDGIIFYQGNTGGTVYNNTLVCAGSQGSGVGFTTSTSNTVKNNIIVNCLHGINVEDTTSQSGLMSDRNVFFNVTRWAWPTIYVGLPAWQVATGQDANSVATDPMLSTDFRIGLGSSAIAQGSNLTSLGIGALNIDRAGAIRPASAAWDAGAYNFTSFITYPGVYQ
jgi:hypothetical protein